MSCYLYITTHVSGIFLVLNVRFYFWWYRVYIKNQKYYKILQLNSYNKRVVEDFPNILLIMCFKNITNKYEKTDKYS